MEKERKDLARYTLERITSEDAFAKLIGMELIELRPGFARTTLKVTEHTINVHQMAHEGALFALVDLACEAASNSFGEPAVAIETNIHFLAAGKCGDLLTATAKLASRVESFGVIEFDVRSHEGRLLSTGQQTVIVKKGKKNLV